MKRRLLALLVLALVASCAVATYPQRRDDTAARIRVENQFSGMGLIVARVMCDGIQMQAIRDVPFNTTRNVRLRRATNCPSGLHINLTDVTGRRVYWRSETLPVSEGSLFVLRMGATLNLSTFYPIR